MLSKWNNCVVGGRIDGEECSNVLIQVNSLYKYGCLYFLLCLYPYLYRCP